LTAYVAREQQGLLLEKPFQISEMIKQGCHLDIDAELKLVDSIKAELMHSSGNSERLEKKTMKKLGLKRFQHNSTSNLYNARIYVHVACRWYLTHETWSFMKG
jgi:fatty acyl-CoA reductase